MKTEESERNSQPPSFVKNSYSFVYIPEPAPFRVGFSFG